MLKDGKFVCTILVVCLDLLEGGGCPKVLCFNILLLSAKRYAKEDFKLVGRSILYNTNSNGPKILPCGTPDETGSQPDK